MRVPDFLSTNNNSAIISESSRFSTADAYVQRALQSKSIGYDFQQSNNSNYDITQRKDINLAHKIKDKAIDNVNHNPPMECDDDKISETVTPETEMHKEIYYQSSTEQIKKLKDIFIPRGIINPNYPGFQKFAHTLADNYIEYFPSDYYDSEMSEYEIEMENGNSNGPCNSNYYQTPSPRETAYAMQANTMEQCFDFSENGNIINKSKDNSTSSPLMAPDILVENYKTKSVRNVEHLNHPDLLNNVGQGFPHIKNEYNANLSCLATGIKNKDDQLSGLSPVNIIGDFGKEVEREFDLLVPGYKQLKNEDNLEMVNETKLHDATLSNGCDSLKLQRTEFVNDLIGKPDVTSKPNNKINVNDLIKPKYQKSSHDDKPLPPVVIDYKQCQRNPKKMMKNEHNSMCIQELDESRFALSKKVYSTPITVKKKAKMEKNVDKLFENAEISQYKNIVNDKEQIIRNSRYNKTSCWARYLEDTVKNSCDATTPNTLVEQFDAYKVATDIDMETLQNHFKLAKDIEKKRRDDREEIRKRLAMEVPYQNSISHNDERKNKLFNDSADEALSDTESHSSDSETCPKLSNRNHRSLSPIISLAMNQRNSNMSLNSLKESKVFNTELKVSNQRLKQMTTDNGIEKCDFFTKQSKLQIEARMALAQSKDVAQMKMKIEKRIKATSPITEVIHSMLDEIGINMDPNKRWISRQMLTGLNTMQLQYLVDNLHICIGNLNANLVRFLMERDDIHFSQDAILHDIEQISRYIVSKEQNANGQANNKKIVDK